MAIPIATLTKAMLSMIMSRTSKQYKRATESFALKYSSEMFPLVFVSKRHRDRCRPTSRSRRYVPPRTSSQPVMRDRAGGHGRDDDWTPPAWAHPVESVPAPPSRPSGAFYQPGTTRRIDIRGSGAILGLAIAPAITGAAALVLGLWPTFSSPVGATPRGMLTLLFLQLVGLFTARVLNRWVEKLGALGFQGSRQITVEANNTPLYRLALFSRHLGEKNGLQYEIAQLFGEPGPIALVDCVQHFISLFEQVRLDGVEILLAVPGAATGGAQLGHNVDEALELLASVQGNPRIARGDFSRA